MTIKNKLLTGAGLLVLSTGFALAAPAMVESAVNLRAGPGPDFPVITAMPAGTPVDVMGCRENWCRVAFGRTVGFADREFLALGGPRGPGYATYGEGYGYEGYSYRATPGYSGGYGRTEYGTTGVGVDVRGGREERVGVNTREGRVAVSARESRRSNEVSSETRTSAELKGDNPMKNYKSTHNPNLRAEEKASAIQGNNPMRIRQSTANPNLRTSGAPAAIKGNNPMKMPQRSTATNEGNRRPSQTTGAAPREERRQPQPR